MIDGNREPRLSRVADLRHHWPEREPLGDLGGNRHAELPASLTDHEMNRRGSDEVGRRDKIPFVLTLLGHDDVAVYDGGWAEWGNRLDLPVER